MVHITDRRDEWWEPDLYVEYFGGAAPVQAWGTVAGKPFYFRARHEAWSYSIALNSAVDPVAVQLPGQGFLIEDTYGGSRDDASYMSEGDAEAIIRRCARLFHEPIHSEGTFLRQTRGKGYVARVEVQVDLTAHAPSLTLACDGPKLSFLLGEIIDVPLKGVGAWEQGALAGVSHALRVAGTPSIGVTITRIQGLVTDTNPTIVGAAAIDAVWKSLQFSPADDVAERIKQLTLSSWPDGTGWDHAINTIPVW